MKQPHNDVDMGTGSLERCRHLLEHDLDLQRSLPSPDAQKRLGVDGLSSLRRLALACELYADRPCFAERGPALEDGTGRPLPAFRPITFAHLWERILALATGLRRLGLADPGTLVGISGFPRIDGVVADSTCLYLAAVSVPLSTTAPAEDLGRILSRAEVSCVMCRGEHLDVVAAAIDSAASVRALVVMGIDDGEGAQPQEEATAFALVRDRLKQQHPSVDLYTMAVVERMGRGGMQAAPVDSGAGDVLRTIVYTSGSTGTPKGAMFPDRVWTQHWQHSRAGGLSDIPNVTVGYMPLNHMAGRLTILSSLMAGGLTSFVSTSDMSTLFDDIRIARPTTYPSGAAGGEPDLSAVPDRGAAARRRQPRGRGRRAGGDAQHVPGRSARGSSHGFGAYRPRGGVVLGTLLRRPRY